jgi:hypothetical protein
MTLSLNIPDDAAEALVGAWGAGIDRAALEGLVAEGYRSGKFGIAQVRRLLGLESRWDAEEWLGKRGIHLNYTIDDLRADRETLDRLLGKSA